MEKNFTEHFSLLLMIHQTTAFFFLQRIAGACVWGLIRQFAVHSVAFCDFHMLNVNVAYVYDWILKLSENVYEIWKNFGPSHAIRVCNQLFSGKFDNTDYATGTTEAEVDRRGNSCIAHYTNFSAKFYLQTYFARGMLCRLIMKLQTLLTHTCAIAGIASNFLPNSKRKVFR